MAVRSLTVNVPEDLYAQLEAQARDTALSFDDLVTKSLARSLPPESDAELPASVQSELQAMTQLSDDALWAIANSSVNEDKLALYDLLIERQNTGQLTPDGKLLIAQLREEADTLMLRKAQAYALLRDRGHDLPTLDELHARKK